MSNPTMPTLQHQLLLNRLPFPSNYNGIEWSTKVTHSRKSIPSYLEKDLPPLKYHYIRQQFKTINKIECPRLTYFQDKIVDLKGKRQTHQRSCSERHGNDQFTSHRHHFCKGDKIGLPKTKGRTNSDAKINSLVSQLTHLRQELTYTLLTTDRSSNVITKLINKGNLLEQQLQFRRKRFGDNDGVRQKKYLQKLWKGKEEESCFADTIQLVINARKNGMKDSNDQIEKDQYQQPLNSTIANAQTNSPTLLPHLSPQLIHKFNPTIPQPSKILPTLPESAAVFDTSPEIEQKSSHRLPAKTKQLISKL